MNEIPQLALHVDDAKNWRVLLGKELERHLGFDMTQYDNVPFARNISL